MSLHAQLSPEALARLHAQQRNSTITSLIIAILVVCLIGIILLWILLPPIDNFTPEIVSYQAGAEEEEKQEKREMNRVVERKPSAPSTEMAKVIAANTQSPTAIPIPEMDVPDPSTDFGDFEDFSDTWAESSSFSGIPETMRKRCSLADRLDRLAKNGGNEQCEEAVMKSLRWIKSTQNPDGSWGEKNQTAMTGFSVLAYLGHCETPNSEEFGDSITRGIIYLVNNGMKNQGRIISSDLKHMHWAYEHGIATYALAETYTFCNKLGINIPNLDTVTKQAGDHIIKGQGESGGWVYRFEPTKSGDNSVGFWQIQALKACKHTGLWEANEFKTVSRKALSWLESVQGSDGAIGYRGNSEQSPGLTGGGVLAFQMWGKSSAKAVRAGAKYIRKNAAFEWGEENSNLYYHYYNAQAMINRGGDEWNDYNKIFRDELLKNQQADGSWKRAKKLKHGSINQHMTTCLATFMLEVYYRFLPATGAKGGH